MDGISCLPTRQTRLLLLELLFFCSHLSCPLLCNIISITLIDLVRNRRLNLSDFIHIHIE